jgi:hypothetical protein
MARMFNTGAGNLATRREYFDITLQKPTALGVRDAGDGAPACSGWLRLRLRQPKDLIDKRSFIY